MKVSLLMITNQIWIQFPISIKQLLNVILNELKMITWVLAALIAMETTPNSWKRWSVYIVNCRINANMIFEDAMYLVRDSQLLTTWLLWMKEDRMPWKPNLDKIKNEKWNFQKKRTIAKMSPCSSPISLSEQWMAKVIIATSGCKSLCDLPTEL